ncbi:hypothetical protein RS130_00230 [Paraglaciecola aquimarina]|uniref:Uncharacterized protein n=1 Tax=Paraglaciecola aquimarina TaxID=1235557 RepID=A0ABU3SRB1_9ALTE|nr:hypothetical protein [Paraglaciecola aquimarina]MDU0352539.1 hypothetical protein [Paraglaciecola aquimarina]
MQHIAHAQVLSSLGIGRALLVILFFTTLVSASVSASEGTSKQQYLKKRSALIAKYSTKDSTFTTLQAQVTANDLTSSEYWSWRIDQYLYGQYPEFQAIYNAYAQHKTFHQLYNLPPEDLTFKQQPPNTPISSSATTLPHGYFTDNLPGNPHRGHHYVKNDKVYITYQGHLTDPYIASFDLKEHSWEGPHKAAESTLSKGGRKIDSHGRPIMEQDSKGHFHIVFGGHGGEREDGLNPYSIDTPHAGGRMLHVMSEKPHDLTNFVQVNDITPFASYTKSYTMANGDIYLFTRAGTHKSPWVYYKMKNGEQRFQPPVIITWPTPQKDDPIKVDTFYITPLKISDTEIAISSLWHECNFHEVHDKTTYSRINAYYMKLDTTNDTFYNAYNEELPLPITLAVANAKTLAFDSTQREETPFGTRPLTLPEKTPALAYEARTKNYREWRMAVLKNGQWQHSLPLPGTETRTIKDHNNRVIEQVLGFEKLEKNTAVVVYKNQQDKTVFATVKMIDDKQEDWRVNETHLSLANTRIQMESVKNNNGEPVAVILNVKKGTAQRLYLWSNGQFHGNH